ncbi:MAG: THUMP-like domain-containing protein [Pirellulaceae bacterium]
MTGPLDDYRWLISEDAALWLTRLAECTDPSVAQVRQLRQALTAERTRLVLEQSELRRRAVVKFESAARMFFTRAGLEQATDQWIARQKARRFPTGRAVADLCCGLGGDLFGLAAQSQATGVDLNPLHTLLAEANTRVLGLDACVLETADAAQWPLEQCQAWHMDPDRRPQGQRTAQLAASEPSLDTIRRLLNVHPQAALKLAPAADLPADWQAAAERQWIGSGRECRQQVAWFGMLAEHPGKRSAIVVDRHGQVSPLLVGQEEAPGRIATTVARFVYEPHACVVAARLTHTLASQFGLDAIDPQVAYLTGDLPIADLRLSTFEVQDVLPFDLRRLRKIVRERRVGKLEVKKRGVAVDPAAVQRQLRGPGDEEAVLLLTPHAGCVRAILARRVAAHAS